MPYKISGEKSETTRIIVIKESDWLIESNTVSSGSGAYEVTDLEVGNKLVFGRKSDGEIYGYGGIVAEEIVSVVTGGQIGIFAGGDTSGGQTNVMDYITINSLGNAQDFGDLTIMHIDHSGTSNGGLNRGIFAGGRTVGLADTDTIEYLAIVNPVNAVDFGNLTSARPYLGATSNYSNDRAVFMGGGSTQTNIIDYITISNTGNAANFGDLLTADFRTGSCSNGANNRGLCGGGTHKGNSIEYITISSTGNAQDFGDLTAARASMSVVDNAMNNRGVFYTGSMSGRINVIDYVTISTTGDATDFGDVVGIASYYQGDSSNGTSNRGVIGGKDYKANIIEYITITTPSNGSDFGDLLESKDRLAGCSNGE